jgi:hypothetical protein
MSGQIVAKERKAPGLKPLVFPEFSQGLGPVLPPKKQITDFSSPTKKQKGQATAKADPCGMTTNRTGNSKTLIFRSL